MLIASSREFPLWTDAVDHGHGSSARAQPDTIGGATVDGSASWAYSGRGPDLVAGGWHAQWWLL
jgi:hypothetical protein